MARYNNEDQRNLEELLEEKFLDRFKARGAQALGAVKGAGQQLKGKAQQAYGGALNKTAELGGKMLGVDASQGGLAQKGQGLQAKGQENVTAGGNKSTNAKLDSYSKTIERKVEELMNDINNDLSKLGIPVPGNKKGLIAGASKSLKKHLLNVLQNLKQ